jgi:GNAT superfamily N-acetyltransferase
MLDEEINIRAANPADSCEIANVHLNSWREAYVGLLSQAYLDSLPLTFRRRARMWTRTIEYPDQNQKIYVVDSSAVGVVGFVAASRARDERFKGFGEIAAIYLLQAYQEKGLGSALLNRAFEYLLSLGFQRTYCWVLENNPTCAFYARTGGKVLKDEIKYADIGGQQFRALAYGWKLA